MPPIRRESNGEITKKPYTDNQGAKKTLALIFPKYVSNYDIIPRVPKRISEGGLVLFWDDFDQDFCLRGLCYVLNARIRDLVTNNSDVFVSS